MSVEESIRIVPKGKVAFIELDLIGEKVNKLSTPVMERLKEVIQEVEQSEFQAAVFISRKKNIFIAGADIEEIKSMKEKKDFAQAISKAHKILNAIEDSKIPFIAAIHGACLGGGCELALTCDYRLCSDDKSTKIGLPEVRLGLIPGFGGCVRLPRTVGLMASLDIILAGKSVNPRKAKKIGLVDEVVPQTLLEKRALEFAEELIQKNSGKRQKQWKPRSLMERALTSFPGRLVVFQQAHKKLLKQTKGFYPAPEKALEVIRKTYGMSNREKALLIEMEAFCEVAVTDVSKHLIDVFFMMEAVKKQTGVEDKSVKPRPVTHMAVLGAGTMGGGIAQVAADCGIEVRMKDISNEAIALGLQAARKIWEKQLKRKKINKYEFQQKMNRISGGLDYSGFGNVQVVVEAIVEDMDIKKKVIAETAKHCPEDCIIATNTSSLSVTEMAKAHPRPENFLGMHFFNPVHRMPLVEVIRGEKTGDEAVATIFELAKKMGKTPVVVKDGPGFLVNRLLLPYMGEALFLLEDGMSVEKVDYYYTHKFGMPMGPFRLMDEVGLDVGMKVLKIFKASLGDRIEVSSLAPKIAELDRLGKKNKKGFYLYNDKGREEGVDPSIYKELGLERPTDPLSEKECLERGIFQMINEASLALIEDRIVKTPEEVDLAMIMGTGFPPFRGGLLKYADSLGSSYIAQELDVYASRLGPRFKPLPPLAQMAKTDRKFYEMRSSSKSEKNSTPQPSARV
ncbi:MAG: fatty oxidation complex subunit alpha [Bdellovibrio sp.]|nr:MAG: fatty oxidation complex subunit alpha [Bdellovibrio sp.]